MQNNYSIVLKTHKSWLSLVINKIDLSPKRLVKEKEKRQINHTTNERSYVSISTQKFKNK
jgi:ribosome biogenesis GTPase A